MKQIIIVTSLLAVALLGALYVFSEPSNTELLTVRQHKKDYDGPQYMICKKEERDDHPCSCKRELTGTGTACQAKDDCYDGDCAEALVSCDDAEDGEYCGCGFTDSTAECCENKDKCKKKTVWGVAISKKCKSYCVDLK